MKKIAIVLLQTYQLLLSPILKLLLGTDRICRYEPTCSAYAIKMIEKYGMIAGSYRGFRRLITCHPF